MQAKTPWNFEAWGVRLQRMQQLLPLLEIFLQRCIWRQPQVFSLQDRQEGFEQHQESNIKKECMLQGMQRGTQLH